MGSYFSRTRSPATELERIALEIGDLKQKLEKISSRKSTSLYYYCMLIFVIFTVLTAHTWLRYDNPKRTYFVGALTVSTIAIILVGRYLINSFFNWRTRSTTSKLEHTISQKGVLLDLVKETLKFKEAKVILDRYEKEEDKQNANRSAPVSPAGSTLHLADKSEFLKNASAGTPKRARSPLKKPEATPTENLNQSVRPASSMNNIAMTPYYQRNPNAGPIRPYLRQAGALDRVLDYFMSDGPTCRNALICSICHTHNGMALPAEFPYISFRCFECGHMNQAKRQGNFPIVSAAPPTGFGQRNSNGEIQIIRRPTVVDDSIVSRKQSTELKENVDESSPQEKKDN